MKAPESVTVVSAKDMAYGYWPIDGKEGPCCLLGRQHIDFHEQGCYGWNHKFRSACEEAASDIPYFLRRGKESYKFPSMAYNVTLFDRHKKMMALIYNRAMALLGYTEGQSKEVKAWAKRHSRK